MRVNALVPLTLSAILAASVAADPGTAFTYQGRVTDNGAPITGTVSLRFSLFTQSSGGTQVGGTLTFPAVTATGGLFTQSLDFGGVLDGTPLFLNVEVDGDGGANDFTTLVPRRPLAPTPYAAYAENSTPFAMKAIDGSPNDAVIVRPDGEANSAQGFLAGSNALLRQLEGNLDLGVRPTTLMLEVPPSNTLFFGAADDWQSFTATADGDMVSFDVERQCQLSGAIVTLHEGTGPAGAILGTAALPPSASDRWQTAVWNDPVPLSNGSVYTVRMVSSAGQLFTVANNPYSGGSSSLAGGTDIAFRVRTTSSATGFTSALSIDSATRNVGVGTTTPGQRLTVVGDASVDGSTLFVDSANNRVGVGISTPVTPLHVVGNTRMEGDLNVDTTTLSIDSTNNRVGIGILNPAESLDVLGNSRLVGNLAVDTNVLVVNSSTNRVGIGTAAPTQALDVVGSARISGTTFVVDSVNSRVGVGTATPSQALEVSGTALFNSTMFVTGSTNIDGNTFFADATNNRVGVRTNTPDTVFHAVGSFNGAGQTPADNVGLFENTSTGTNADVLLLKVGTTGNPGTGCNFISFIDGDNVTNLGAIQGNGAGSVELAGAGNDYAEWLPRLDAHEILEPGDVVGVFGGRITKRTDGADAIMVLSSNPIVSGNVPGDEALEPRGNRVAFVGQAQVKVHGPVALGDYIVASGEGDGTAVAIGPGAISPDQAALSVGRAWEASKTEGLKTVNTLVGLAQSPGMIAAMTSEIRTQQEQIRDLNERLARLEEVMGAPQVAGK